jgi:soluble cytochrome b562
MANDLFGGLGNLGGALGGLMGGLATSGLVPKDPPEGKLLAAQSDMGDLQAQEKALLLEIGRLAYERNASEWPQDAKLKLIRENMAAAKAALDEAKQAQEQADAAKAAADAIGKCANCGHRNPEGVKFCQECGASLAAAGPKHCASCGAQLAPGTRFCGECGERQGE